MIYTNKEERRKYQIDTIEDALDYLRSHSSDFAIIDFIDNAYKKKCIKYKDETDELKTEVIELQAEVRELDAEVFTLAAELKAALS